MAEGGLLEKEFRDLYQNEGGYKVGLHALQKKVYVCCTNYSAEEFVRFPGTLDPHTK